MWTSIQRELNGLLDMLSARGVKGAEQLREEAGDLFEKTALVGTCRAVHTLHEGIAELVRKILAETVGLGNYLFGTDEAGKVKILEHCIADGPSASVSLIPSVGTHDVVISITRVPKDRDQPAMTLARVEEVMGRVDDRRIAYERSAQMANEIGLGEVLGDTMQADGETYALVSECLLFLRQLLAVENARTN